MSCIGKADGELCSIGTQTGICDGEVCLAVVCGDGIAQGIEQCDGSAPETTCLDLGYDVGFLGCIDALCVADLPACHRIGWRQMTAPSTGPARRFTSAEDVGYALRGLAILRYRANAWEPIPQPTMTGAITFSIYAGAADDLWAVTEDGIYHFDGTTWRRDPATLESIDNGVVFGTSATDVYLLATPSAGSRIAMHNDGNGWVPIAVPTGVSLNAAAGAAGVFVANGADLLRWSGASWQSVTQPLDTIHQVVVVAATVVLAGVRGGRATIAIGDGMTWTSHDVSDELAWVSSPLIAGGRSSSDLYVAEVGATTLVRFDGVRWLRDATSPGPIHALAAIGTQMFAGMMDGIAREAPSSIVEIADTLRASQASTNLLSSWGRSCDDLFVVATSVAANDPSQILRFDGTSWAVEAEVMTYISTVSGTGDATYATTNDGLLRRTGTTWTPTGDMFPTTLQEISSAADGTIVVSGVDNWVHVFDGMWRRERLSVPISGVFTSGRDGIYAITPIGVFAFDGTSWIMESSLPQLGNAIWGSADGTLFAVGRNGQAWHRSQGTWTAMPMPFDDFISVHGTASDDVFAVGLTGTLAHFDGRRWSPLRDRIARGGRVWSGGDCIYFSTGTSPHGLARLRRGESW